MRLMKPAIFSTRYRRMQKLFDPAYYLAHNADVRGYGASPFEHFLNHGFREGRNPSADFCTLYYKDKYLKTVGILENPLRAHVDSGAARNGVQTVPASEDEYLAIQADVVRPHFDAHHYRRISGIADPEAALLDYLRSGWRKGLAPCEGFDGPSYLGGHAHVAGLNVSPFYHYVSTAERPVFDAGPAAEPLPTADEVRSAIGDAFDAKSYLSENADVAAAGLDPLDHYVSYGWREGRNANEVFWTAYYLEQYGDVRSSGINPFYHFLKYGRAEGRKPNPVGHAKWPRTQAPLAREWRDARPKAASHDARVVVVMPVYKGYDETLRAIHAVLSEPQAAAFELMVLNDRSPDATLTEELRGLSDRKLFRYYENPENLGFVGTVNRALSMCGSRDVILLNSDTIVFGDWLDRLLAHADADPRVGTITPMSNNATICSYPDPNRNNVIALEVSPRDLDGFAAACNAGQGVEVPTGVGFCFYMRGALIKAVGALDVESFGKGYGEENDYCMRILKAGYKNVFATDVFVYHSGKISFSELYDSEYGAGQSALHRKHPDYLIRVARYVAADPAADSRLRLDLFRLARSLGPASAIFVVHSQGGGASVHADHLARRLEAEGVSVVYFVVSDDETIEIVPFDATSIYTPAIRFLSVADDYGIIEGFIDWLAPRFLHVHAFYGLSWHATTVFMELLESRPERRVVTLHDYSSVCVRNHLVNREGNYCALPDGRPCANCTKKESVYAAGTSHAARSARFRTFYAAADSLIAPSHDARRRIADLFGSLPITVKPHEEDLALTPLKRDDRLRTVRRVGIIGAIGAHKGSGVVYSLALDARARDLRIAYYIIGYSDMPEKMAAVGVTETGRYLKPENACETMEALDIDLIFIPSIWPETYCYTLSIPLAAKVPVAVFDLGAPADRLRDLDTGFLIPPDLVYDPGRLNDHILALPVEEMWARAPDVAFARYDSVLKDYYGLAGDDDKATDGVVHPAVAGGDRAGEGLAI